MISPDSSLRILIIEDNPGDFELVQDYLSEYTNPSVIHAGTFKQASLFLTEPGASFDVILLDLTLPDKRGKELITGILNISKDSPVIILSGYGDVKFSIEAINLGISDYLLKDELNALNLHKSISYCLERQKKKEELNKLTAELQVERARLLTAQEVSKTGSWERDFESNQLSWSRETHRIFGTDPSGFNPTYPEFLNLVHPEDREKFDAAFTTSLATTDSDSLEHRIITKQGAEKWVEEIWSLTRAEDRTPIFITGTCKDITERKISEEKMRESQQHLAEAQRLAKMGSWSFDFKNDILTWSDELYNVFDTDKETFTETHGSFLHLVDPNDRALAVTTSKQTQATGKPFDIEYRITTKKGEHRVIHELGYGEKDEHGNVIRLFGTAQDVTARKKAEEEQSLLVSIINSTDDAILTKNLDGIVTSWNHGAEKLLGYSAAEIIGKSVIILFPPDRLKEEKDILEIIQEGNSIDLYETERVRKDGRRIFVSLTISPIRDYHGNIIGASKIARDITERKKLEQGIKNERDQFFNILFNAPAAIGMMKGADHVFEMANPGYLNLIGKTDIVGKTLQKARPELIEQGILEVIDNVYKTGKSYAAKELAVKIDKEGNGELTEIYLRLTYQAYNNSEGAIDGVIFFAIDITEQILLRKELEKSERFFKGVIENSEDMLTVLDSDGKTTYASPSVSKKFGYTPEEVLQLNVMDVIHPEDIPAMGAFMTELLMRPEIPMSIPLIRERKKDGSYIWVEGTLTNFLKTDGINAIVGNFRDVTERLLAEKEILESEAKYRSFFENSMDGILLTVTDGAILAANPAACKMFQMTEEEICRAGSMGLVDPEDSRVNNVIKDRQLKWSQQAEITFIRKDGTKFPAELSSSIFSNESGENRTSMIIKDITARKLAETERLKITADLIQRNNDLEQFSYIISHNLRAPVANIVGLASEMSKELHDAEMIVVLAEALNANVNRLETVIMDLNTILQTKREITEKKELVIFSALVRDIQLSINDLILHEKVTFSIDFAQIDRFSTIKSYMHSIFYNLISNSIKYRQDDTDPIIAISSRINAGILFITFKDNGSGMDLVKTGEQIFGLYKRFHLNIEGKGMGLYMVKTQVETLGGKISVRSEVGKGTEFVIELPYNQKENLNDVIQYDN